MAGVSIRKVEKSYETYHAVRGIDLEIPNHAFVVLVGPSGCGKSTTLRMIAGLEDISSGEIRIGDRVVNDMAPGDRDIAMVFQNYALYPHMSVRDNIAFGLKQRRTPKAEIDRRIADAARMLDIEALLDRKPRALSGGQRQRVAMGRAMVRNPSVFLFDEPLSNLDAKLRVQMRTEIKRLHQTIPTTTIYVTHDQIEAMTLADLVVVMNKGVIEQAGPPQELYHRPATRFVASFIGSPSMNFFEAKVEASTDGLELVLEDGTRLPLPAERRTAYTAFAGRNVVLGVRPEHLLHAGQHNPARMEVTVDVVEPLGQETLIYFSAGGAFCCARLDPSVHAAPGEKLLLAPEMNRIHLIDPDTDKVVPVG